MNPYLDNEILGDCFIDKCSAGTESTENIETYVKKWLDEGMECELWEFLGFRHPTHYSMFIQDKSFVNNYCSILRKLVDMPSDERQKYLKSILTEASIVSTLIEIENQSEAELCKVINDSQCLSDDDLIIFDEDDDDEEEETTDGS